MFAAFGTRDRGILGMENIRRNGDNRFAVRSLTLAIAARKP